MTPLTVAIVAPQGCGTAITVVNELDSQLTSHDEILIVEVNADDCHQQPHIRHVSGATANEMVLRRTACVLAQHDIVLVIEDHTLPTHAAVEAARQLADSGHPFLTYYLSNGSANTLASRAFYRFIHSGADVSRWPEKPALVPSVFAMYRPAVEGLTGQPVTELRDGEIELELLPSLTPDTCTASTPDVAIEHHQAIGIGVAMVAVYSNARVVAATPVQSARTGGRGDRFQAVWKKTRPTDLRERGALLLLLASSVAGTLAGRIIGLGSAPKQLADAHPTVQKFTH